MTGASFAAPHGREHHHHHRCGGGRQKALAQWFAMMGPGGRHGFGRGPFGPGGPGGFGFGGPGGPGGPRGRGRRARRGDIRAAALLLLAEEPRNGYQIMQEVEERSDGWVRPSPGSVYPALSQLEDEGLIRTEEHDGRKAFAITDAGRRALEARGKDATAPWEQLSDEVG